MFNKIQFMVANAKIARKRKEKRVVSWIQEDKRYM